MAPGRRRATLLSARHAHLRHIARRASPRRAETRSSIADEMPMHRAKLIPSSPNPHRQSPFSRWRAIAEGARGWNENETPQPCPKEIPGPLVHNPSSCGLIETAAFFPIKNLSRQIPAPFLFPIKNPKSTIPLLPPTIPLPCFLFPSTFYLFDDASRRLNSPPPPHRMETPRGIRLPLSHPLDHQQMRDSPQTPPLPTA